MENLELRIKIEKEEIYFEDSIGKVVVFPSVELLLQNIFKYAYDYNMNRLDKIIESLEYGLECLNGDKDKLVKYLWGDEREQFFTDKELNELDKIKYDLDGEEYKLENILYEIQEALFISGVHFDDLIKPKLKYIFFDFKNLDEIKDIDKYNVLEDKKADKNRYAISLNRMDLTDGLVLVWYKFLLSEDESKQATEELKGHKSILYCPMYIELLKRIVDEAYSIWRGEKIYE